MRINTTSYMIIYSDLSDAEWGILFPIAMFIAFLGMMASPFSLYYFGKALWRQNKNPAGKEATVFLFFLACDECVGLIFSTPIYFRNFCVSLIKEHPAVYSFFFLTVLYTAHQTSTWLAAGLSVQRFFALKYPLSDYKHWFLTVYPYLIVMPTSVFIFKLQYFTMYVSWMSLDKLTMWWLDEQQFVPFNLIICSVIFFPAIIILMINTSLIFRIRRVRQVHNQLSLHQSRLHQQKHGYSKQTTPNATIETQMPELMLFLIILYHFISAVIYFPFIVAYVTDSEQIGAHFLVLINLAFIASPTVNFVIYYHFLRGYRGAVATVLRTIRNRLDIFHTIKRHSRTVTITEIV